MNFLFPAFLIGALAIAIPIVLHFMRRDVAPEVPFSAVRLLHKSPLERSRRRRLRDLLLLAARVVALLLLAAAFARPYASGASASSSDVRIVAIDRSFSMGAPGRFAQAVELAREAINDTGATERVALIAFDDRAEVVAGLGTVPDARAALAGLEAGAGATRYGPLFAQIVETAAGAAGRVVVITDMQRAGWEDERRGTLPSALQLEVRSVEGPAANVGIIDVRVERDRLLALIRNTGSATADGRVRVTRDGTEVAAMTYTAPADATAEVSIPYRAPSAGALALSIDDPTGAVADNTHHVLLDPVTRGGVLIVTAQGAPRSGFYLSRALSAAADDESGAGGMEVRLASGSDVSAFSPDEYRKYGAVALLSTRGLDRAAREGVGGIVQRGGGVLIAAAPDVEPDVLSTMFEWRPALGQVDQPAHATAFSATDLRHPIFRPFGALAANLGQVRFDRSWRLRPEGWNVAARFTDGSPALLDRRQGQGRVVLFASDLDRQWNDFPLHPGFVPFAVEAMRHVAGTADYTRAFTVGAAPAGVPRQPGVHSRPADASSPARTVVVNVDPRESSTAAMPLAEFEGMLDRISLTPSTPAGARAQQTEARQSYWQYGLLLMLAALVMESFIGRA
jgi:hypothetical protein